MPFVKKCIVTLAGKMKKKIDWVFSAPSYIILLCMLVNSTESGNVIVVECVFSLWFVTVCVFVCACM